MSSGNPPLSEEEDIDFSLYIDMAMFEDMIMNPPVPGNDSAEQQDADMSMLTSPVVPLDDAIDLPVSQGGSAAQQDVDTSMATSPVVPLDKTIDIDTAMATSPVTPFGNTIDADISMASNPMSPFDTAINPSVLEGSSTAYEDPDISMASNPLPPFDNTIDPFVLSNPFNDGVPESSMAADLMDAYECTYNPTGMGNIFRDPSFVGSSADFLGYPSFEERQQQGFVGAEELADRREMGFPNPVPPEEPARAPGDGWINPYDDWLNNLPDCLRGGSVDFSDDFWADSSNNGDGNGDGDEGAHDDIDAPQAFDGDNDDTAEQPDSAAFDAHSPAFAGSEFDAVSTPSTAIAVAAPPPAAAVSASAPLVNGRPLQFASMRDAYHAVKRMPIVVPDGDDWQAVLADPQPWVARIMNAYHTDFQRTPPESCRTEAEWLRYQEQNMGGIQKRIEDATQLEIAAWMLFRAVIKTHKFGVRQVKELYADASLACSARLELLIDALEKYSIFRFDVIRLDRNEAFVANPNHQIRRKIGNFLGNGRKKLRNAAKAEAAAAATTTTATTATTSTTTAKAEDDDPVPAIDEGEAEGVAGKTEAVEEEDSHIVVGVKRKRSTATAKGKEPQTPQEDSIANRVKGESRIRRPRILE